MPSTHHGRKQIELSAGTVEYEDTGEGPALVLLHGALMDPSLWADVVADLSADYRCIVPALPLGAHTRPVRPDADLSLDGLATLTREFLAALDLHDVTLAGNDTGGAIVQAVLASGEERVGQAALVSCDAFDNFPPGLTGKVVVFTGKLPPRLFGLFMQQMRLRALRRLPIAFGWLTKRGDAATARWIRPVLGDQAIRRDAVRMLRAMGRNKNVLTDLTEDLAAFDRPVLVAWARDDRVMPPEHGRRLAALLPKAQLVEIPDSYTLIPLDRPMELARAMREFLAQTGQGTDGGN
ncbi:MAG: alpha/beta hydrolase [Streptomycetaceae bacterium]|jgi:pimeloyl-ACP methyl ester carboxylesterase|nr:alpha/beta hydrolase [Streptomycetaceae bacterium]